MPQNYKEISRRYLRLASMLCLLVMTTHHGGLALALTRSELYQTVVPVADRSDAAQAGAFAAAMRVVVVRVTGRRNAEDDPAFAALVSGARRYVQQYRAAPDNKLWVSFDGSAIERWLTQNGQPLWGPERPTTLVWLEVTSGQTSSIVTAGDTSELKSSIDAAADLRGIPLVWPSTGDIQKGRSEADVARARGAEAVLTGRASNATAAAPVRWTHQFQERSSEYSGTLEGVNRAADVYALLFAASGNLAPIDIDVSGVADLRDYAAVQGYLESLTFISHVSVVGLTGDQVRFRLSSRGGIESLQHTLALTGKLQTLPGGDNGIPRFQLRH